MKNLKIDELIENPKIREKVEVGISKFYHPDATEQIAKEIISLWEK